MNHGLILEQPKKGDYVLGSKLRLAGVPLTDGQWDAWVPQDEVQNLNGVEPYACVSFGTLNAIEILERQEYGATDNYSDRFLAKISGTQYQNGNTPNVVSETLRKKGCPPESAWPFNSAITSFDGFYADIPAPVYSRALEFTAEYEFGHEWVPADPDSMMEALKYSPLGVSVYAWAERDGLYYRPQGSQSTHWCVVYGYARNQYWKVFDSYDNTHKKLAWDFGFDMVKRYTLHRQVVDNTAWGRFKRLLFTLWPF